MSSTNIADCAIAVRARYAMSGTEIADCLVPGGGQACGAAAAAHVQLRPAGTAPALTANSFSAHGQQRQPSCLDSVSAHVSNRRGNTHNTRFGQQYD
eukprot:1024274-Rhodomonas_salina.1